MNETNPKVDGYIGRNKWKEEMTKLRSLLLATELAEELKWGKPCYALDGKNVVLIVGFKEYLSLLFAKGVLLKDPDGILIQPTENSQAARQIRFTSLAQITKMQATLKKYIKEAIEVEKAGLQVTLKKVSEFAVPEELQSKFDEMPDFKAAFEALTPGRQRGYLLHFAQPKQSKTREARVEKYMQNIFDGKGLDD